VTKENITKFGYHGGEEDSVVVVMEEEVLVGRSRFCLWRRQTVLGQMLLPKSLGRPRTSGHVFLTVRLAVHVVGEGICFR
jgi:hypothetical protein